MALLDAFYRIGRPFYDWMYRRGAPWESGARRELVDLVSSGAVTPASPGPRAIDLGCGSGADCVYLAERGFEAVGVDYSAVAIEKAIDLADEAGVEAVFRVVDILELPEEIGGPFDLLFDGGTLDDFPRATRPRVAEVYSSLARPGSVLVLWCFYARDTDLPRMSFGGPSRWGAPGIEPDELVALFGTGWDIDLVSGGVERRNACFALTRR